MDFSSLKKHRNAVLFFIVVSVVLITLIAYVVLLTKQVESLRHQVTDSSETLTQQIDTLSLAISSLRQDTVGLSSSQRRWGFATLMA
jgi:predicted PurR-regulated permease PerM